MNFFKKEKIVIEVNKRELINFYVNDYQDMITFINSIAKKHNISIISFDDKENYLIECEEKEAYALTCELEKLNIKWGIK